jgi:two-component system response regulator DevR
MKSNAEHVRILLADDHTVVREGLRALIERHPEYEIVAEASSGDEAVAQAKKHRPDIVVMDIQMPGRSGIEACRVIVDEVAGCRVILLTSYAEEHLVYEAVRAGASAYVLKRGGTDRLVEVIERVSRGENALEPAQLSEMFDAIHDARHVRQMTPFRELTGQELEVLALIAQGMTNREIAAGLGLAVGTVRNYVSRVLDKLNVANRTEAAAYAVQHNISDVLPSEYHEID